PVWRRRGTEVSSNTSFDFGSWGWTPPPSAPLRPPPPPSSSQASSKSSGPQHNTCIPNDDDELSISENCGDCRSNLHRPTRTRSNPRKPTKLEKGAVLWLGQWRS